MSDREASNYSIQPRYPYPQSPPMGALAAADSYSPTDWPAGQAELPDIGAPLLSPGPQVSAGQLWANRLADTLTTPPPASTDNTVLYKTANPNVNFTQADIDRGFGLGMSFSGGGLGIKAYHGSPHDFDRFDLTKIGTGEGAQAYGHGLYFAENEGVATGYRDRLKGITTFQALKHPDIPDYIRSTAYNLVEQKGEEGAISRLREMATKYPDEAGLARAADIIEQTKQNPGKMYEVNINADPAHFLDWDKALSEMSPEVQKKLSDFSSHMSGAQINESARLVPGAYRDNRVAAENLAARGIPGIKYLDEGSRNARPVMKTTPAGDVISSHYPAPTSNYVVFNDKLIDILRKYGLAGAAPAGMGALAAQDNYQPQ